LTVGSRLEEHASSNLDADEGLRAIGIKFALNLALSIDMAHSLTALVRWGEIAVKAYLDRYPEATFTVGIGHPETATVSTTPRPLRRLLEVFSHRDTVTNELMHAQVIQYWQDFLDELLLELTRRHFTGSRTYRGLGAIQLRLDCRQVNDENLIDELVERAGREFAFMEAAEKLRLAARALGASIPQQLSRAIKKDVTVRNVLQHNDGILRDEDLKRLGLKGAGLPLRDNRGEERRHHAGDRVAISFWEVMGVCADVLEAATVLIPDIEGGGEDEYC
jgi:hypothetical protein